MLLSKRACTHPTVVVVVVVTKAYIDPFNISNSPYV